ncbi:hypothetical protein BS47DRAFT_1362087 [Hydnum rufescens UP504]|uniref:Uncharacterized protein n=1 Tax=Hydnum rufescens UP504 TaxID=1448309 RepID=A0A9P6DWK3_9AGAM|nr:hypothetical protein BS47DRAFT_1362087 [Hydnum rufescens UP504]
MHPLLSLCPPSHTNHPSPHCLDTQLSEHGSIMIGEENKWNRGEKKGTKQQCEIGVKQTSTGNLLWIKETSSNGVPKIHLRQAGLVVYLVWFSSAFCYWAKKSGSPGPIFWPLVHTRKDGGSGAVAPKKPWGSQMQNEDDQSFSFNHCLTMGKWALKHKVKFKDDRPLCKCNIIAIRCHAKKGQNNGKIFYTCHNNQCTFLSIWLACLVAINYQPFSSLGPTPLDTSRESNSPEQYGSKPLGLAYSRPSPSKFALPGKLLANLSSLLPKKKQTIMGSSISEVWGSHFQITTTLDQLLLKLVNLHLEMATLRAEICSLHLGIGGLHNDIGILQGLLMSVSDDK